uniref:Uncharacterized protein n=1 Tax=Cucumis melo TaxID=3656 RepID=A0A9I9EAL3_CUCME
MSLSSEGVERPEAKVVQRVTGQRVGSRQCGSARPNQRGEVTGQRVGSRLGEAAGRGVVGAEQSRAAVCFAKDLDGRTASPIAGRFEKAERGGDETGVGWRVLEEMCLAGDGDGKGRAERELCKIGGGSGG